MAIFPHNSACGQVVYHESWVLRLASHSMRHKTVLAPNSTHLLSVLQVAQIFMPILNQSPLANFTASKFGSIFGQGLVFLQNVAAGLA